MNINGSSHEHSLSQLRPSITLFLYTSYSIYIYLIIINLGCKCAEFYCQGVVLEDTSCRVYAAPGNATKGELICIPTDLLLEHYTYEYTENFEHYAKCKPYYQMTACTNVSHL